MKENLLFWLLAQNWTQILKSAVILSSIKYKQPYVIFANIFTVYLQEIHHPKIFDNGILQRKHWLNSKRPE